MGAIAAMWMLVARSGQRVERPAEVELEPIEPGAWAAWARENEGPAPRLTNPAPRNTCLSAGRFEVNAAVYPRGYGLRWLP
jgi:hypothetical protein